MKRRKTGKPDATVLHVTASDVGRPLSRLVADRLGLARGEAERRILVGLVAVHGNLCDDGDRRMRTGDVVHVRGDAAAAAATPPAAGAAQVRVVFRDDDLLVVEKPAGVTSVREPHDNGPARGFKRAGRDPGATLDELLQKQLQKQLGRGVRVRPVHRLDRDTSGLMCFALSAAAASRLSGDLKAHRIDRTYRAVVHGRLDQPRTLDTLLVRDRGDGRRGSLPPGVNLPDAKRAVTHVRPVEAVGDFGVVECRLETGRTHQIRIHLSEIGHPLCGDREYGPSRRARPSRHPDDAPRQALHAAALSLSHPATGKTLSFDSDWPPDLRRWLKGLRERFGAQD